MCRIDCSCSVQQRKGSLILEPAEYRENAPSSVTVGCFAAFVIEEAKKGGFPGFAGKLEDCLMDFLKALPREERRQTLMLSHQMATVESAIEPFRLRLVYARS
jgi:hypothetical protein